MRAQPYSRPDPGRIYSEPLNLAREINVNTNGKTARAITINPLEKTLVLIAAGQSLATNNVAGVTFTPANAAKLDNFSWVDGSLFNASTPSIGVPGAAANFNLAIADGVISNGKFNRVIVVPAAVPGVSIANWVDEVLQGGAETAGYARMIRSAVLKLASQGVTPQTTGVKFLIKWNQGESDTQQSTSQADYMARFNRLMTLCGPLDGAKWMVAKETRYIGNNSAAVQAAQLALVNNVDIFAGENMDSIGSGGRTDDTHLNATGYASAVTMGIAAITAITF